MATTHISAADAVKHFDALLARIQIGETFVIEKESLPVAIVAAPEPKARLISEIISVFKQKEAAMDEIPVLDPGLAEVVEERIRNRRPRDLSKWA
jgi:antitoxin (DNA-binding transcriptional repressor) of toxin-antitoxin stability system